MESFVFNNFKYKLINGEVPKSDTWYFWPVNEKFVNDFKDNLRYFKTSADFSAFCPQSSYNEWKNNLNYWENYQATLYRTDYVYEPMGNTDIATEPEYVSYETKGFFKERYPEQSYLIDELFFNPNNPVFFREIGVEKDIDGQVINKIGKGFYYIRTAEELRWCANKVNSTSYDNTINIVLGDNIGTDLNNSNKYTILDEAALKIINFTIGSNPAQPYEGIFFGNGFRFRNIKLECSNDVNGIIGYLGTSGRIDSVDIYDNIVIQCNKEINIEHLVQRGTDVAAGFLCGKNNGSISNIRLSADVIFNNFVPRMYSVKNKGLEVNDSTTNNKSNDAYIYYPDYYCYNNPGNIIPYIGYFNEGVFATFSGYNKITGNIREYWSTELADVTIEYKNTDTVKSPLEWYYWDGLSSPYGGFLYHQTAPANRKNILWYDGNIVSMCNYGVTEDPNMKNAAVSVLGLVLWDTSMARNGGMYIETAHYFDCSIKMQQQNRVAYYIAPVIGVNNNEIRNVNVNANIYLSGTFVGFMGGIIGKQNKGIISDVLVNTNVDDLVTINKLTSDELPYVDKYTYYLRDYIDTDEYWFPKKSIKNIGGVIGSLVVGDVNSTILNNVQSNFINNNKVIFKPTIDGEAIEYDDYYFMNRFGGIAPMIEYNSCNVSDIWNVNGDGTAADDVNNIASRSIHISNSIFQYSESFETNDRVLKYRPSDCVYKPEGASYMLGVTAPLFAELKPTYLSIPSLTETPFFNAGKRPTNVANPEYTVTEYTTSNGFAAVKYNYYRTNAEYNRVGTFTIDQQIAAPLTDPNFWCINVETDLPGVANRPQTWTTRYILPDPIDEKGRGIAGGTIDRLNNTYGLNFDLDITNMAGKLISWTNSYVIENDGALANPFTATTVPANAIITPANCYVYKDGASEPSWVDSCPNYIYQINNNNPDYAITTAVAKRGDYHGNKFLTTYPYFGSDLIIEANEMPYDLYRASVGIDTKDVVQPGSYSGIVLEINDPRAHRELVSPSDSHYLYGRIEKVKMEIKSEAFNYVPFTDIPISTEQFRNLYDVKVYISENNYVSYGWVDSEGVNEEDPRGVPVDLNTKFGSWPSTYPQSGFIFYSDWSEVVGHSDSYLWYVIPFEMKPFSIDINGGFNPPHYPFESFYVAINYKGGSHWGGGQYTNFAPAGASYSDAILQFTNQNLSISVIPNKFYFQGYTEPVIAQDDNYVDWGTKNVEPSIAVEKLTGYQWDVFDGIFKFKRADNPSEGTLNVSEALTGYVSSTNRVSRQNYILAEDTTLEYPRYDAYTTDINECSVYMSAVPLNNIDRLYWNWQNPLVDYIPDTEIIEPVIYNYEKYGNASQLILKYNGPLFLTSYGNYDPARTWLGEHKRGKFKNGLLPSAPLAYDGITPVPNGTVDWVTNINTKFKDGYTLDPSLNSYLDANIKKAMETTVKDDVDFYKFTYRKFQTNKNIAKNGIPVYVDYNSLNNKAGFWFHNSDNEKIESMPTDGKVKYYPNVFNIGKTVNQECIRRYLKIKGNDEFKLSGFSADDFQGLYVTDSKRNPVMYIDVGLGECNEGTSWSLSAYPSKSFVNKDTDSTAFRKDLYGLMLEVD